MANTIWKEVFLIMCSSSKENARNTERFPLTLRITDNYTLQMLCGAPHNVCNDEGKINGMLPNRSVKNKDGVMVDFIFGPAFICDCRGESFDSLSDEQIARYTKMFRYPEHLARLNGKLIGIPFNPQREHER